MRNEEVLGYPSSNRWYNLKSTTFRTHESVILLRPSLRTVYVVDKSGRPMFPSPHVAINDDPSSCIVANNDDTPFDVSFSTRNHTSRCGTKLHGCLTTMKYVQSS